MIRVTSVHRFHEALQFIYEDMDFHNVHMQITFTCQVLFQACVYIVLDVS